MKRVNSNRTVILVRIALFVALIIVGAFIRIPLPFDSYFTLQIFFVTLSGLFLGPIYGSIAVIIYIVLGLFGVPVFAGGGGISYVIRPSFGYIIGFIFNAFLAGIITYKKDKLWKYVVGCLVGMIITYAIGLPYQYFAIKYWVGNSNATFLAMFLSFFPIVLPLDIVVSVFIASIGYKLKNYALVYNKKGEIH